MRAHTHAHVIMEAIIKSPAAGITDGFRLPQVSTGN